MKISPDKYRLKSMSNLSGKFTILKFEDIDPNSLQSELDVVIYESSIKFLHVDTMKDKTRVLTIHFEDTEIVIPFVYESREQLNQLIRLLTSS
ncbi:MAG: hypothetical protein ACOZBL_04375 [Patescibacteria group bacterium]